MAGSTLVPVTFRFPGHLDPVARHVAIVGSFNNWDPSANRMSRTPVGDWTATILLAPGRAVYGFWVDGMMWLDPSDEGREPNIWGSEFSVRTIDPRVQHARSA